MEAEETAIAPVALSRLKVIVADDHAFFRLGLKSTLQQIPYVRTIHEAANGEEVLKLLEKAKYDVIFMDIEMPQLDGIETVRRIRLKNKKIRIIALSMHASEKHVMDMYHHHVNAYILKDTDLAEVKRTIENVIEGQQYFAENVRDIVFNALIRKDKTASAMSKSEPSNEISPREIDVLKMICDQYSTQEIAENLHISLNTVKGHREKLLEKTNSKNLAGIVVFAIKHGYYRIP